ncbi:class II glutamine amidotransferase [Janibacter limosus]|uniref:Class II glutamine amidotransferase n=1 Tax=Janibacter limosus TaxID=53458 RepID=A0A4P6MSJ1_9MICO|nr:class II glutamine amidotransferase [Janibacter limosus]QBF45662.1 class II glutamine amidotransferase [Janibacter limosus]
MCRVLAYIGPEISLENLLLKPENSLINQALDPERHPELQLAGWGFGAWSEHLLKPEEPFIYRRPMAAFYDDNATRMLPSLQASTMLAHVRAAAYHAKVVMVDENCHPFCFEGTPWIVAQNGYLPGWQVLQRELLQHCKDEYLTQMLGTTDTEFVYALLLSLLEGNSDEDVQRAVEELLRLVAKAMKDLDLPGLTKLKMALVSQDRIIGINWGLGHQGEVDPAGDWRELRKADAGTDDFALGMLLEPMYLLLGRNFQHDEANYGFQECTEDEATAAVFASEPLSEDGDDWIPLEYGSIMFLAKDGERITRTVKELQL